MKKFVDYYDEEDLDIEDLKKIVRDTVKEDSVKSFSDLVTLDSQLERELCVGEIYEGVGTTIDTYIKYWNKYDEKHNIPVEERKPIKIYINSAGGSLIETFTMIDAIEMSKTPVWTIAIGAVYSGGFFTFITGHKRIAYPHSSFLYHEGSTSTSGDAGKFRNFADFYKTEMDQLKEHTLKHTKITEEWYKDHVKDDVWLTAEEAVELGVADEIAKEFV